MGLLADLGLREEEEKRTGLFADLGLDAPVVEEVAEEVIEQPQIQQPVEQMQPDQQMQQPQQQPQGGLGTEQMTQALLDETNYDTFQERGTLDKMGGVLSAGANMLSGIGAQSVAGIAGLGTAALTGIGNLASDITGQTVDPLKAGADVSQGIQDRFTIDASPAGQQFMQEGISGLVEKGKGIFGGEGAPVTEGLEYGIGLPDKWANAAAEAGYPGAATAIKSLPEAVIDLVPALAGLKLAKRGAKVAPEPDNLTLYSPTERARMEGSTISPDAIGFDDVKQIGVDAKELAGNAGEILLNPQTKTKREIAQKIKAGSVEKDTALYELTESIKKGTPRVKKDAAAQAAVNQGFDEAIIASVKGGSPKDSANFREMVEIKERGKRDAEYGADNRASDVLGRSVMERVDIVKKANKQAAQSLDKVADSLEGKPINIERATDTFAEALDNVGVQLVPDGKGGLKPDFTLSDLAPGDRGPLKEVIRQMNIKGAGGVDAKSAHKLKRAIDNNVVFGKTKTGLSGAMGTVLKDFRRDIDTVLDNDFPEYNRINTGYSETISALDALRVSMGGKIDLSGPNADKAAGTAMRKLLSNQQGRLGLQDAIDELTNTAKNYEFFRATPDGKSIEWGGADRTSKITDNLLKQVLFVDELDRMFKPSAKTGFAGQIGQEIERGIDVSQMTGAGMAVEGAKRLTRKVLKRNEEEAFKSIKKLLNK